MSLLESAGAPAAVALLIAGAAFPSARPAYPPAKKGPVVDDYHGTRVPDPYRELEDQDAPDTARWVEAQNALTRSLLAGPRRERIAERLTRLFDYPRVGTPERQGQRLFFTRNTGLQNQSVLFVREGRGGKERVLLDPNSLSADGTVALTGAFPTQDGALLGYSVSRSGSDRQEIHVRDVATGQDRADKVLWAKFTALTWTPDHAGFYYTRFPEPGKVPAGDENYFAKVYYHRLGEPQSKDALVYERNDRKELIFLASLTQDGRYLVLTGFEGSSDKSEVYVLDRTRPGAKPELLFPGFAHAWIYSGHAGGRLFFRTDQDAPLGRLLAVDWDKGSRTPAEVIPQGTDTLLSVTAVKDALFVHRLKDASSRLAVHTLDGRPGQPVELPALGTVDAITGESDDDEVFFSFTSYAYPAIPFRYDVRSGTLAAFDAAASPVDSTAYEVKQVFYPSKDGTRVSMFLVHRKGLEMDGRRPTILYGYGGFNINVTPAFKPERILWLENGGVFAVANLRGGGEYGEEWHQAGMLARKQNTFDDFLAAADWLVANRYTSRDRLAVQGGSNGGLLVGAALTQRPDAFGAALCHVPVADMLRYHLFTVGRYWIPEYGSSEDPRQFAFLYRYSPLHNVKDGTAYPATLITTADTDDRVAPGLAKKFAARLQEATAGTAPVLLRVETKAGHGAGKPVSKQIDESADVLAFLWNALGIEEPPAAAR